MGMFLPHMSFPRVSSLLLSFILISLAPSTGLSEQPVSRPALQKSPPSMLVPPRPITVNKETMDRLVRTPPQVPSTLTGEEQRALHEIAERIKARDTKSAMDGWSVLLTRQKQKGLPVDIEALVQWVLREAYLQSSEDLTDYANKVKYFNAQKNKVRSEILDFRNRIARECTAKPEPPPGRQPHPPDPGAVKCQGLVKSLGEREARLPKVAEDEQLANIEMQKVLQKQLQALEMLSGISKMLHDTAMAVIRKIGS